MERAGAEQHEAECVHQPARPALPFDEQQQDECHRHVFGEIALGANAALQEFLAVVAKCNAHFAPGIGDAQRQRDQHQGENRSVDRDNGAEPFAPHSAACA